MKKIREGYKMTELGEIPQEWDVISFFNFIEKIIDFRGRTPKKLGMDWGNGNIVALSANNVKMGKIDFNLESYYASEELYKKWMSGNELSKGDILMTMEAPLGNIAIVPDNNKYILSQRVVAFKTKDFINNTFMKYMLMSDIVQSQLEVLSTGTTAKGINQKNLAKAFVIIPTLKEQEKIASILSTVDEQIDNVDALIEKNKELKKGLMQTLLTKGIGHTKFKKTEIGEIPEEWEVKKLECVFEILDSMRKPIKASDREKIEGDIPYYGASGVIDWINDYIFDEELILLGEDGENLNSRNSDLAFKISGKTWVNNHAHVFRVINKKECNIDFMVYYLEAKDYSIYIAGSAQPKITQAQCRKFLLPLPKKEEQDKIASILSEVDEKIAKYENKKQMLEELKKGLMQQLLTGKIRVK